MIILLTSEVIPGSNIKLGLTFIASTALLVYTKGSGIITIEMFSSLNWNSILRLPKYPVISILNGES